ncbi:T-cell activation Rho GTPase-activating protein-like [Gymnogyps californianus]|uniref:T-cell activation Rho GTPase-activating protein-like n=1 Tax=Gymnogyps californianus TaxID=33616 RepID=UPI0021C89AA6|nr:T-cell activation Rho GTPase-activating protein-like [Gymnogyps californianus]
MQVGHAKDGRHLEQQGHPLGSGRWTWFCGDTEPLLLPTAWTRAPGQAGSGCSRPLFGQPLAAVCGEDGTLPQPIQELLAVLQREGPSTEGIFRRAASATAFRELREALDCGAHVDLGSQPALLLAVILKDFLRSIPAKLLVSHLYEDWMAAMQKASKEEKMEELKAVAEKLPAANLLLLQRLLSLLQRIGHNASTSRMTSSNLAVCLGPNLLSPPNEDQLPLQAMLEVTAKVNVLVEFLTDNWRELFGEEPTALSCPAAEESPAPPERCRELPLEEQSVPAVRADTERQAEALLQAPPSLLGVLQAAGADMGLESETGEAPPALPPSSPESAADSLVRPEELASLAEERRFAGSHQDKEKREAGREGRRGERRAKAARRKEEEERNRAAGSMATG